HSDMEIISIVFDGQLAHKDSLGNGRVIEAGDIQYMSAGSGVVHSEFNPSKEKPVHFMQIWIEPSSKGLEPRYADQSIIGETQNEWKLILSPDGLDGSMAIRQDVELFTVELTSGKAVNYQTDRDSRGFWLFVLEGAVEIDGETFSTGDSVAFSKAKYLDIKNIAQANAKVMFFDVPV
ncbi:MAG: pirin family protein, partial [Verrucomicrobiota bacterium]